MLKRINVLGTKNICRFALTRGVKKFIYVSSIAVNSGNIETPLTEDLPYKPTNRYGVSKMEAEKNAIQFRGQGLPMVILRPCMVYGEREPHLIPLLINLMRSRLIFIPYFADAYLHLVSVRNVAACFVRCMEDDRALGHVFNVADKEIFTLHELFEIISESLGIKEPPTLPKFLTNVLMLMPIIGKRIKFLSKDRLYDIIRLKDCIDFAPPYSAKSELFNTFKLPRQLSLT
jgi:nucleoside-diphosphate-sugar epimerase